jgi:hypothetical protein
MTKPEPPQVTVDVDQGRIDSTLRRPELRFRMAIVVDVGTVRFTDPAKRERYVYRTPPVCQRALTNFERGVRPRPFSFTLADGEALRRPRAARRRG